MKSKDNSVYVDHMLDCILRIDEYVENKDQFYSSQLVQDAVVRNLQVMSESSQRLANDVKKLYPDIPWKQISGFRNILVHDYLYMNHGGVLFATHQALAAIKWAIN